MKSIKSLVLVILCIYFASCGSKVSSEKTDTPHAILETAFETIKNDDFDTFKKLIATSEDVEYYVRLTESDSSKARQMIENYSKEIDFEHLEKIFKEERKKAISYGIADWNLVNIARTTYSTYRDTELAVRNPIVDYTYKNFYTRIELGSEIIQGPRGWRLIPYRINQEEFYPFNFGYRGS